MSDLHHSFTLPLLAWFDKYGRKDLPWQHPRSAYHVWVSEIMLQQTQVQTVIPYFQRFMASFPDVHCLAQVSEDKVLAHWSGLGYYSRARNLYKTAKIISDVYAGQFPSEPERLVQLPGIGVSTAAAISSQAFNKPHAILDANVKRVLSRYFMVDGFNDQTIRKLWTLADNCMSQDRCADYTQAIMDLGAICCKNKNPNCPLCPVQTSCGAYLNNLVQNYPAKKLKKTRPIKSQQFLILHQADKQFYLEKRPPTGIWGGLWCLPAIETEEDPANYIRNTYSFESVRSYKMSEFRHSFTHFHLHILPWIIEIKPAASLIKEMPGKWFVDQELTQLGLAKPIRDIINQFLLINSEF